MSQQQLTSLTLRKVYHAEQLGMPSAMIKQMRDTVQKMNDSTDFAVGFIQQEGHLLEPEEQTILIDRRWNDFRMHMFNLSTSVAGWINDRVKAPGGFPGEAKA